MRNLTKTIAAVSMLVPATAYPLGIGDIELHSALNQKLDAEIALFLSAGEDISDIKVRLAPPEKFDEAGVPWSYFLSKIKFKAVTKANGETVVELKSRELLREPFLDFLLEVSWATGNLYREFTVLVDPPVTYVKPAIPVIQKPQPQKRVAQPLAVFKPASRPIRKTYKQISADGKVYDEQYGPINKFDTLWEIADKTNIYDDVSIEQMMMSIYKANPKAFYKKNVNALMAGQMLNIPDRYDVLKLSKKQALAAFKRQNDQWLGRSDSKTQQSAINKAKTNSQLELEAPTADEVGKTAVVVNEDAAATTKAIADSEKVAIATVNDKGLSLQSRMEKLEQQLEMMQKMLVLKDEQIAALQNHKHKSGETVVKPVDVVDKVETKTPEVSPVKPVVTTGEKKDPKPKTNLKPKAKPVVAQPESETGGMTDYLSLIIGGLIAVVLAILGWFWWRNRQDENESDTESMFASASEINLPDSSAEDWSIPVADDSSLYDVGTVGESSFLSEFTPSDFDAFDTDQNEIDPISEADVYLAYGRYQQAEELMRQAIQDEPERDESKLKLLEIFYVNENKEGFDTYAKELVGEGKHEDKDFWAKVVEMGVELGSETSLYTNSEADVSDQETALKDESNQAVDSVQKIDDDSEDFDLSVFDDNSVENAVNKDKVSTENFDLSEFDTDGIDNVSSGIKNNVVEGVENIDFDFESGTGTDGKAEDIDLTVDLDNDVDLEMFDFSLDDEKSQDVSGSAGIAEVEEDIEEFDFDLDTSISGSKPLTELDTGVSGLSSMDELETKIDLAKAYIDMGDAEAAKSIAEEVFEKGNSEQKESAQGILDQIE